MISFFGVMYMKLRSTRKRAYGIQNAEHLSENLGNTYHQNVVKLSSIQPVIPCPAGRNGGL